MLGGTLTELAIAQDRLDALVGGCTSSGCEHIEVSDGTITLEHDRKLELIARLAKEFTVLSEVGSKDNTARSWPPFRWVEQIESGARGGGLEGDRRGPGERERRASSGTTARCAWD